MWLRRGLSSAAGHASLLERLARRIRAGGPITVAEYMKRVLMDPGSGYYTTQKVFGPRGDFVTSPEISQLFGELIGVWTIHEWQKLNCPKPLQIVELGPGTGTMINDILKVYKGMNLTKDVSVHLVEMSGQLARSQFSSLGCGGADTSLEVGSGCYQSGTSRHGINISWYGSFSDVPPAFSCIIANEFFDALPIHKFQKTEEGWRELLIDIDDATGSDGFVGLRYVISRHPTPASKLLSLNERSDKNANGDRRSRNINAKEDHKEVSLESCLLMKDMCSRLEANGGIALIIDYGHTGDKYDTFRGFKNHTLQDPLVEPGTADLTADVDFAYLKECAPPDQVVAIGPVTQSSFLSGMHINLRLRMLLENCRSKDERDNLMSGYKMLMDSDKMGERFKFMALFPAVLREFIEKVPVAGFDLT